MIPDPMEALRQFLLLDADVLLLSAGRVYAGELPRSEVSTSARTCLVLRPSLGFGRDWAYIRVSDPQFDMRAYGATISESYELHLAAHSALKQMGRNIKVGCMLHWAKPLATPMTDRDPETEWPFTLSTWQVLVSEMEVL